MATPMPGARAGSREDGGGEEDGKGDTAIDQALEELPEEEEELPRRHFPVPEDWIKSLHCMNCNRYQLKQVLGIVDKRPNRFWDLCVHCWLPCCSVLQEHKEIIVRTEPGQGWLVQQGHLYMKPYQRTFDDALELVWEPKPPRPRRKKDGRGPKAKPPDLVIKRRRSVWRPVDQEQEFETFYA